MLAECTHCMDLQAYRVGLHQTPALFPASPPNPLLCSMETQRDKVPIPANGICLLPGRIPPHSAPATRALFNASACFKAQLMPGELKLRDMTSPERTCSLAPSGWLRSSGSKNWEGCRCSSDPLAPELTIWGKREDGPTVRVEGLIAAAQGFPHQQVTSIIITNVDIFLKKERKKLRPPCFQDGLGVAEEEEPLPFV